MSEKTERIVTALGKGLMLMQAYLKLLSSEIGAADLKDAHAEICQELGQQVTEAEEQLKVANAAHTVALVRAFNSQARDYDDLLSLE